MLPYDSAAALEVLKSSDPCMSRLVHRVGPFELTITAEWSPFQALVHSVIFQQISKHAGQAIQKRLFNMFGGAPEPDQILQSAPGALRKIGLSQSKEQTIRGLAIGVKNGTVADRTYLQTLDEEEIIRSLTKHRGIGPWTVQMLLLFNLGRPDVWPITDLGIRRGYRIAYDLEALPEPSDLINAGDSWKPFRSVASWYLWQANDL